jgi:hypothetical protein
MNHHDASRRRRAWAVPVRRALELALTVVAAFGLVLRRRLPWASLLLALPALFVVGGPTAAVIARRASNPIPSV